MEILNQMKYKKTYIGIIPARYGSKRFEGKSICDIKGKPMIQWVYESVMKWKHWQKVYVATDNEKIKNVCISLSIPYIMTSTQHIDCLDRAAEVVYTLETRGICVDRYIIIQGDEPLFDIRTLDIDLDQPIINFYTESIEDKFDVNVVKVVVSTYKKALYFSRYSIPYCGTNTMREKCKHVVYKQIGVYIFSAEMLKLYSKLPMSNLEMAEGIGLNRFLENNIDVFMQYTKYDSISVDTPKDRERIIELIENGKTI